MINDKIKSREELKLICEDLRKQGKKIGFTSGSFDILHAGHSNYLEKAKLTCDVLIVGINSDESVKKYKGDDRPIVNEKHRLNLIAALNSVDFAFLFNERRNKDNILALKPDYYIKAGDYKESELTSAEYMKEYGGQIKLIPIEEEISSSTIINKISSMINKENLNQSFDKKPSKTSPAIFIDRDGTINEEVHFLHEPEKFKLYPTVLESIKEMQNMGYKIVIITNQGGIGLGYFTKEDFFKVNSKMFKEFSKLQINVDKIYFCPHSQSEKCMCRKPFTGLFDRAKEELNIDMKRSFTIGDKTSDIQAGKSSGTKTILVKTGHAGKDNECQVNPDFIAENLMDAIKWIKKIEAN